MPSRPAVGVLALQGDVREHARVLSDLGADVVLVRRPDGALEAARKIAYDVPWSHAVLRALELSDYRALRRHQPGWLARRLGISREEEERCLSALATARQIKLHGGLWVEDESKIVDTRAYPERGRRLQPLGTNDLADAVRRGIKALRVVVVARREPPDRGAVRRLVVRHEQRAAVLQERQVRVHLHRLEAVALAIMVAAMVIAMVVIVMIVGVTAFALIRLGVVPEAVELLRIVLWILVTMVYIALWLAFGLLLSVAIRRAATSALVGFGTWLLLSFFGGLIVSLINGIVAPLTTSSAEDALKNISNLTRGEYFYAGTADDLKKVYDGLNTRFVFEKKSIEITALFAAVAAVLTIAAAGLSVLWFHRIV